jgi:uncharacterized ferritin-like protein (DUF455 family)
MESLFTRALECLGACIPAERARLTRLAAQSWCDGRLSLEPIPALAGDEPARPARPRLVDPLSVPRRRLKSMRGRAAFVHALAHIEFNAIALAWDCIARFRELPRGFYDDWTSVADDEARHFTMLCARLSELGFEYGDFDAHDGLWEMASKTRHDLLARMAMIPRVLEAHGLDVTPGMIERLHAAGDPATAGLLEIILDEEVGHVAAGTRWFRYECATRELDPLEAFRALLARYWTGRRRAPLNIEQRLRAGFSAEELAFLASEPGPDRTMLPG